MSNSSSAFSNYNIRDANGSSSIGEPNSIPHLMSMASASSASASASVSSASRMMMMSRSASSSVPSTSYPSPLLYNASSSSNSYGSYSSNNESHPQQHNHIHNNARQRLEAWSHQTLKRLRRTVPPETWAVVAGAASFGATLGVCTTVQQRILGLSTGSPPPLPSLVGVASVCLASTLSHQVALGAHAYATTGSWPGRDTWRPWPSNRALVYQDASSFVDVFGIGKINMHTIRIWTMGLLCFKLLGGRFWAVAPSSLTHLGSYARASLPANANYATASQRFQIERLGRTWGCHTCGSHRMIPSLFQKGSAHFVGDHMPPKSVAHQLEASTWYRLLRKRVQYRLYPQCISCSNKQGSLLGKATAQLLKTPRWSAGRTAAARHLAAVGGGRFTSYNHAWQPRLFHWTGAVLGGIATWHAHPDDVLDENRWRYAAWQQEATAWCRETWHHVVATRRRRLVHNLKKSSS